MAKTYTLVAFILLQLTVAAQIPRGSFLVGGDFSYSTKYTTTDGFDQRERYAYLSLSAGKAIRQNTVAGLRLTFAPVRQNDILYLNDTADLQQDRFLAGLFVRKYKSIARKLYLFGQADAGFSTSKQKQDFKNITQDITVKQHGVFTGFTPGLSYQLFRKLQVELALPNILLLQYFVTKTTNDGSPQTNS